jgi:hypothetical protein
VRIFLNFAARAICLLLHPCRATFCFETEFRSSCKWPGPNPPNRQPWFTRLFNIYWSAPHTSCHSPREFICRPVEWGSSHSSFTIHWGAPHGSSASPSVQPFPIKINTHTPCVGRLRTFFVSSGGWCVFRGRVRLTNDADLWKKNPCGLGLTGV